jgi:hypothetical protein
MANEICVCNNGIGNTALPNCGLTPKVIKKVIFVPLASNAGVLNKIDPATTLNLSWVNALLNNADKSLRWFPTPEIKNIDTPKADPVFEKYEDGSSNFIREDVRKFAGLLPICPPMYKAKLESVRCNNATGVYLVDIEGNMIGLKNGTDGYLYPMPINAQSIVAKVVLGNDKSTTSIMLDFEFPASMQDADIYMISGAAFTDFSPLAIGGLLDVNIAYSAIGAGTVTATITTPSPALNAPIAVQGLVSANFVSSVTGVASKLRDTTSNADVAITTVTETTPGVYVFTYTLAAAKVVVGFASLAGYDFANLKLKTYTTV